MSDISEKVLAITIQVLGPASRRFLERQTKFHLDGLEFDDLKKEHIPELAKWVGISAQLVVDEKKASQLAEKIKNIS
ncbi:hypothetical protein [Methanospirillum hungatei]|jgi:hypothetical protein|uniref:hypothetical protein n=1 Tax=Methanospirillum hungatei TaxID=2203 RepID=UPI0009C6B38C|nr:hypothetical protein [Methanospirillum hungatei]MBP7034293.1 hypothetical protein [Methanospirillum sp.]MBP9007453.1 hypothetical protein [Methanospirillum sp.]OQA56558.1 MAG: hypothetical protein BWY45_01786 [Euryarchaeota archaeon ADurb.Bin294]HOW03564.1 hypothetical protein [Methanospirillum hungatei]